MKLRLSVEGDGIVIEPARDALWLASRDPRSGR
jgi:lipocalin